MTEPRNVIVIAAKTAQDEYTHSQGGRAQPAQAERHDSIDVRRRVAGGLSIGLAHLA